MHCTCRLQTPSIEEIHRTMGAACPVQQRMPRVVRTAAHNRVTRIAPTQTGTTNSLKPTTLPVPPNRLATNKHSHCCSGHIETQVLERSRHHKSHLNATREIKSKISAPQTHSPDSLPQQLHERMHDHQHLRPILVTVLAAISSRSCKANPLPAHTADILMLGSCECTMRRALLNPPGQQS
jgi:hypothetical protein